MLLMHGVPYAEISAGVTVIAVANDYFCNIYICKKMGKSDAQTGRNKEKIRREVLSQHECRAKRVY